MKLHTDFQRQYYPQVIEIYKKTGYSAYKIEKMQLVPVCRRQMQKWIATFEAENGKGSLKRIMEVKKAQTQEELEVLKAKVADLEEQLRIEKLRNRLNDKIIEIAEQRWHIEIRKKAGTKQ